MLTFFYKNAGWSLLFATLGKFHLLTLFGIYKYTKDNPDLQGFGNKIIKINFYE